MKEGLADWEGALVDYDKAISLWGGRDESASAEKPTGLGINPFVLTFRGNTLCKLNRYEDAVKDYGAAADKFSADRDIARYSDARANQALALYQTGRRNEAVKVIMKTKCHSSSSGLNICPLYAVYEGRSEEEPRIRRYACRSCG